MSYFLNIFKLVYFRSVLLFITYMYNNIIYGEGKGGGVGPVVARLTADREVPSFESYTGRTEMDLLGSLDQGVNWYLECKFDIPGPRKTRSGIVSPVRLER